MACGECRCGHGHHRSGKPAGLTWVLLGVAAAVAGVVGMAVALEPDSKPAPAANPPGDAVAAAEPEKRADSVSANVLGRKVRRIDGTEEALEVYRGKVLLIVNVASKCGMTPQYAGLEQLYKDKKEAGLVVLGFPANNFRAQEPGSNSEIAEFCRTRFGVTFPMFEKISVLGADQHPLYRQLASQPAPIGGDPSWNFTKFLVDRTGNVVARFEPKTKPDDPALVKKIDELLAAK